MKTLIRSLAFTLAAVLGTAASAQNVVTITGTITPCQGVVYPVHFLINANPVIDTTIYTGANCEYSFTFNPVASQGSFIISTSCNGGMTWTSSNGAWQPFFPVVTLNLSCDGGICLLEAGINAQNNQPWEVWFGAWAGNGTLPYQYSWEFSDGSSASANSYTWTLQDPGSYSACLLVTDANGCEADTCFYFDMDADGNMIVPTGGDPCNPCVGITQPTNGPAGPPIPWTLQATNCSTGGVQPVNYYYDWSNGETTQQIITSVAGEYLVCIYMIDANGCQATFCDSVMVDENGIAVGYGGLANDECNAPTLLPVNQSCQPVYGNLAGATESMAPSNCNAFVSATANDVWYAFVAVGTSTTIQATGGGTPSDGLDIVLEVFADSCSLNSTIDCADVLLEGGQEEVVIATTPGTVYYYRVYPYSGQSPSTWSYSTCVFGAPTVTPCTACFTVSSPQMWIGEFSNCSLGGIAPYTSLWTFPDATTSSLASPTFNFLSEGVYQVCLAITDADGCTNTICQDVSVDEGGLVVLGNTPCIACLDVVPATDGQGVPIPFTVVGINCSTGGVQPTSYLIEWGDGTSGVPGVPHTYANPGWHEPWLFMTDANGCSVSAQDVCYIDQAGNVDQPITSCTPCLYTEQYYDIFIEEYIPFGIVAVSCSQGGVEPVEIEYLWSTGETFPIVIVSGPGTYWVCMTMNDANGCDTTVCDTVVVDINGNVLPPSTAECTAGFWVFQAYDGSSGTTLPIPYELWLWNLTSGGNGNYQFLWEFGDGATSTEAYPTHIYGDDGPYELCLTMWDTNNCTDMYCDSVSIDGDGFYEGLVPEAEVRSGFTLRVLNELPNGIADQAAFDDLALWPNPATEAINLTFNSSARGNTPLNIYDLNGRTVAQLNVPMTGGINRLELPVTDLTPGMYLLRIGAGANAVNLRFVKN